jgi:hypothetical protein
MNRYQPSIPRTAIGLAAFAFLALVIAATVVLPAERGSANGDAGVVASARGPAAPTAIAPDFRMHLEVVGTREPEVATAESAGPKVARYSRG